MSNLFTDTIEKMAVSLLKSAELAVQYGADDVGTERQLERYTLLMEQLCECEQEHQRDQMIISQADKSSIAQFDASVEELEKTCTAITPKETQRFVNFVEQTKILLANDDTQTTNEDDDEMQIMGDMPDVDPITKQPLENPVRNKICNHVYGNKSIREAIMLNSRMKCPAMGCPNKKELTVADLVDDPELMRKLSIQRRRQKT